ncbi:MAG: formylglycine-generating enzyme family protein [Deltaproteobacteria bacterium]|nr:formylglycine-generating enzyme family protein [Deltaproteobacteria bacterium]
MIHTRPHPLDQGHPPKWASGWGEDQYGVFAVFEVGGVEQLMRWIPPGEFSMGSPEEEAGHFANERQHQVTLTKGLWLGNTQCNQALWQEVTGENPSKFKSEKRPVEEVSWQEAKGFLEELKVRVKGLSPRLPTEAEWEWACRAETRRATYAGDLEILGLHNAPILDSIAWYGGNSGVDFDLDNGADISSDAWKEKQYPETTRAGTRIIGQKAPNPWGFYDMLGNVWEWCEDYDGPYSKDAETDPTGPAEGAGRVIRGGSWYNDARNLRAAYRNHYKPSDRAGNLGFRLAQDQE